LRRENKDGWGEEREFGKGRGEGGVE